MQGPKRPLPLRGVVFTLVLVAAFSAAPASAKLPRGYQVTRVDGSNLLSEYRLGDTIVNAGGDIDFDDHDDLVAGIGRGGTVKGRVLVLNGVDGTVIREIPAPSDDFDGDGTELESDPPDDLDAPTGFGAAVQSIADMGMCRTEFGEPGGGPGQNCDTSIVSLAGQHVLDGVPEILVSAPGLDIAAENDDRGAVFVIDGDTGAILHRLRAPDSEGTADFGFGRSILVPAGESACAGVGKGGVNPDDCEYSGSAFVAVARGDINNVNRPDIVVGAPDFDDTSATNPACSDGAGGGTCSRSGRVYVFHGEDLANSACPVGPNPQGCAPDQYPASYSVSFANPFAQHDDATVAPRFWAEEMGASLAPVGDLGSCVAPPSPGATCPQRAPQLDGHPEFTIAVPRTDDGAIPDAGVAFVVDGASGRILDTYRSPEPKAESLFGFANYSVPPIGNVGGNDTLPDIYMPAIGYSAQFTEQGRGYVFNGSDQGNQLVSVFDDPTPVKAGNFGTAAVGVGNVAGAEVGLDPTRKEVLVGNFGPQDGSGGSTVNDVSFFSPLTDRVLQTVIDPDRQSGSGFGRGIAPLGDTNGDSMLDFAVGAGGFDSSLRPNRGRIYIFTSDDTPPPASSGGGSNPPTTPTPSPTVIPLAGRTIELEANRSEVRLGRQVTLRGVVEAFANNVRCERNQTVEIQRRRRGTLRYRSLPNRLLPNRVPLSTSSAGTFSVKLRPDATYYYRARLAQSTLCIGAVSPREQVVVRRRAARSPR